jgi:hypothetical protein
MAKKRQARKPPPESDRAQLSVINLKGTGEFRDWLAGVSKSTHIPAASIVRLALAEWAGKHGHPAPPER